MPGAIRSLVNREGVTGGVDSWSRRYEDYGAVVSIQSRFRMYGGCHSLSRAAGAKIPEIQRRVDGVML